MMLLMTINHLHDQSKAEKQPVCVQEGTLLMLRGQLDDVSRFDAVSIKVAVS